MLRARPSTFRLPRGPALAVALSLAVGPSACSSKSSGPSLPAPDTTCAGPCPQSNIKHVVLIVQENHTFDTHYGAYCKAAPGSSPSCTSGPECCEAMPPADPAGNKPVTLDDDTLGAHDPDHTAACETAETNGGKMDMYVSAPSCGSPMNVAVCDPKIVKPYWDLAATGALADRYFQPTVGQSSANDMYFARAAFVFNDNEVSPQGAIGTSCSIESPPKQYQDTTIGDLLTTAGVPWAVYADGYQAMADAVGKGTCPDIPPDCPANLKFTPCLIEPADVPFEYFASTRDNPATMKDFAALGAALDNGSLPAFAFVKPVGYHSEHPGYRSRLSDGVAFMKGIVDHVMASRYRSDTLVIVVFDEGGGYFDHVQPPMASDGHAYGTRVPFVAVGPFAKKNFVSHTVMEHSSVVKFLEWNFLGGRTGQLMGRDANVNNIGSLLDPATSGGAVPEH